MNTFIDFVDTYSWANAFQHTTLLTGQGHTELAQKILLNYLDLRIRYFDTADEERRAAIRMESIKTQTHMWALISRVAKHDPNPLIVTALNATNDLYTAQQKTMASWRHQIPGAAWAILILFGICSNFLIGYHMRGKSGSATLLLVVPAITSLALFMISEIDIPGKGIIHVTPHNLEAVKVTVDNGGLTLRNTSTD
jgi:hypothetical protein